MLVDPVVGGVVSTIGSVASSLLSGSSASRNQRELMDYNSPVNQVRRLRQAGLNPALAMTNGMMDSGNVSAAAPPMPQFDTNQLAEGVRASQQLQLQERSTNAQVANTEANTEAQRIRNKTQLMRDLAELMNTRAKMAESNKNTEFLDKQIAFRQKEIDWFDRRSGAEIAKYDAEAHASEANAQYQDIMNRFAPQQQSALIRQINANSSALYAAAKEHNSAAVRNQAEAAVARARKAGLDISNDQADALVDVIYNKTIADAEKSFYEAGSAWKMFEGGKVGSILPAGNVRNNYPNSPSIHTDWQVVPRKHRK